MISTKVMSAISYNPQDVVGEMISPKVMSVSYYFLGFI
jgi:hypothetical protein